MRASISAILLLPLAIAGCDKPMPPAGQDNGTIENAALAPNAAAASTAGANASMPTPDEAPGPASGAPVAAAGTIDRSHAGEAAPAVAFLTPDGKRTTLSAFRGKPVLLNLWATWCAPCVKEMPTLDAAALAEKDHLQIVAVSQDMEGAAKVGPYFAKAKFATLKPYLDPQLGLSLTLKANLPTSILYDAAGKELWRVTGGMDWTGEQARALLAGPA